MKYKNKDGIELNYTQRNDVHTDLVKEVVGEAVRICDDCNWYNKTSVTFALNKVKKFLIENFNLEDE